MVTHRTRKQPPGPAGPVSPAVAGD
jgi:hypothetical protein